jgi:molybdopterin synthase catalytic subunit
MIANVPINSRFLNSSYEPVIVLTEAPLVVEEMAYAAESGLSGGAGAVVTFVGVVRDNALGHDKLRHEIDYLEYSAYAPMATRQMRAVAEEVREKWELPCAISHRLGRLNVGEASVVIAVASPHRREAFEACHGDRSPERNRADLEKRGRARRCLVG